MPASKRPTKPSEPLVLLIDDADDSREVYAQFLQHVGLRAATAVDGQDGLEKAATLLPSVIVLDLGLPKIDGWEVTRRLKTDPATRRITIIAVTGHADADSKRRATEAGVDEYCVKPCGPEDLMALIRRHI